MNRGKFVFAQITAFLPQRTFRRYVEKYDGDKRIKHFSCWNQMLCMMFGQLSGRDSLRDLTTCLTAHATKSYQLGIGKGTSRSNLAEANENRDYRIYEDFAYSLVDTARKLHVPDPDFGLKLDGARLYAFDATVVDLCLNVFLWARFRKTKAAVKLHTLFDLRTSIPAFIHVTEGAVADVRAIDELAIECGAYYVVDRGYLDYKRLWRIHESRAWFVVRAKDNMRYRRVDSDNVDPGGPVICDQMIVLGTKRSKTRYPEYLRRIKYYDKEQKLELVFLTNNFDIKAEEVALLYKYRWSVEIFFKWIKQHLRILSFWGTTVNAVKTQVYIAMLTFVLISIVKTRLKLDLSLNEILQVLSVSLLDRTPLTELLKNCDLNENGDYSQFRLVFD